MSQSNDLNTLQKGGRDAHFNDDEINLFDLVSDLNLQKRWFITPAIICLIAGVVYALLAKPVYQVKSVVKPASDKDLVALNPPQLKGKSQYVVEGVLVTEDVFSMDVEQAYELSKKSLLSKDYRKAFYQKKIDTIRANDLYNEGLTLEQNFIVFDDLFSVSLSNDKKDAEQFIQLKLELGNAELATSLLNQYVRYSLSRRLIDVKETFEYKLTQQVKKLEYEASLIRDEYYTDKSRERLEVAEALSIAKEVGIKQSLHQKAEIIGSDGELPRYMFGERALAAEKTALDQRGRLAKGLPFGEDHFIQGLPAKRFEIKKLKELKIDFTQVKLSKVDELATLPRDPIKPKKLLIVLLSGIAGIFLGLVTALIVAAYKRYLKERE